MFSWIPDGWRDDSVQTNGINIHYWRTGGAAGGDRPPLLLLHGITDSGLCWRRVAERLQDGYDLIMVDGRGHGLSDKPEGEYPLTAYADDMAGLIEALGLGKPAVMGHSLGGGIATVLAGSRPELVRCVVLEDPPWRAADPKIEAARQAHMQTWQEETRQRKATMSRDEIIAFGKARSTTWHEDEFEAWAQAKLDVSERVFNGVGLRNWPELAAKIECPALLIGGDPELGGIVTPEVAEEIAARNSRIQYKHIVGAGHNVRREQFEAFMATVEPFLAKHA